MPAERAVFLDRDDTILDNDGYLGDPTKVKLLPGAASALAALRALGYRLIVVSNQSGVARGMFDEAAVQAVNDEMGRQLREAAGTHVDASYYCPYHPEAVLPQYKIDHEWRKPKPGMLKQAAVDFRLDLTQCWMIGDMDRDIAAGIAAGCRTILLVNPDLDRTRNEPARSATPTFVCKTLADAARIIAREGKHPPHAMKAVEASPAMQQAVPDAQALAQAAPQVRADPLRTATDVAPAPPAPRSPAPTPNVNAPAPTPPAETDHLRTLSPGVSAGVLASPQMEHKLDELITQLRHQNRNAELHPEFSLGNLAALIVQLLALAMFLVGMVKLITLRATFAGAEDVLKAILAALQVLAWLCGAGVLQGVVVALLLHARHR